uniref:Alanine--glyoxylate aminotransferase n=2 Tax=Hirondellea gigas TaxID=1518452 RepID=A0A6A7G1T5_9CRUS
MYLLPQKRRFYRFLRSLHHQNLGNNSQKAFCRNFSSSAKPVDKLLFTPGPLTTSYTVKAAALHDYGSRDQKFMDVISEVKSGLLSLANVSDSDFACVLMQGSGTYSVESMLTSVVPRNGCVLLLINGAYGHRAAKILKYAGIDFEVLVFPENEIPNLDMIDQTLKSTPKITDVFVVHSETTSGIINPIDKIGKVVKKHSKTYLIDAMSSFGAINIDFQRANIDYLVSSANKCIEGIPGFAFCIARKEVFKLSEGNARSFSLDLFDQDSASNKTGQFRFTPPTHALLAFRQALKEIKAEGGVEGRFSRYKENRDLCISRMKEIGFEPYLDADDESSGCIITSFRYPKSENWNFQSFYEKLSEQNMLIYPGKVSNADCFRIGHIGRITPNDTAKLLDTIEDISLSMKLFN